MNIRITGQTRINDIREAFNTRFPYLKLEFFQDNNHDGKLTAEERVVHYKLPVSAIRDTGHDGVFHIEGLMTVAELERAFRDVFGILVQVFRKSGNIWLQTTATDNLTLAEQNHLAIEMNEELKRDREDFENNRDPE